jgi:ABC-type polar amino acid transport system ATPase subunit
MLSRRQVLLLLRLMFSMICTGRTITANGYDVRKARRKIGMVFQSFNLFAHLTVIENLMLAPMDFLTKSRQQAVITDAYEYSLQYGI